jgi:hypothetical protein
LQSWGERWTYDGERPIALHHETCGATVSAVTSCSHCGEPLLAADVRPVAGPGLDDWPDETEVGAARERIRSAAAQAGRQATADVGRSSSS